MYFVISPPPPIRRAGNPNERETEIRAGTRRTMNSFSTPSQFDKAPEERSRNEIKTSTQSEIEFLIAPLETRLGGKII